MFVTLEVSKLSGWLNTDAPENMDCMLVTLEVSKLSGWLNADAPCRESKGGHTVLGEVQAGRRRTTAAQAACRRDSTADWGQGTGRSARRTCSPCP